MHTVTKTFGHERGFAACFRQHKAEHSHCSWIHGYALSFEFTIGCHALDERNWVFDFGGCQRIKRFLEDYFDHKLLVAKDDPEGNLFALLMEHNVADVITLDAVGCEAFAEFAFYRVAQLVQEETKSRAFLMSVKVSEHGSNSATFSLDVSKDLYAK
jgi:6-pyruvoyltetrahydropterin/6-carboxytetrahydropterin synthase